MISSLRQRGFSLLEVLVTLVLLSIGLLGVAALQLNSLRYAATSGGRNQAALFAQEVADRIRANPDIDYSGAIGTAANCYASGTCTAAQLRASDLADLNARVSNVTRGGLQNGRLTITSVPVASGGGYQIKIDWQETAAYDKSASSTVAATTPATLSVYTR